MYIDFHSHILPGIDDGAENTEMSLKMIDKEKSDGAEAIVATPHFSLSHTGVTEFLVKREEAYDKIKNEKGMLPVILGAEVFFTPSLSNTDLKKLCIGDTNYLLVELPYQNYTQGFINSFHSFVNEISGEIIPILAHAERYLSFSDEKSLYEIMSTNMLVQLNSGSFSRFSKTRSFMINLIKHGAAHLLGTDCHNMTTRAPNMMMAKKYIEKKISPEAFENMCENSRIVLSGGVIGE